MIIHIELSESDIKELIREKLCKDTGLADISLKNVKIEVKSKQNYRSEWEEAAFRGIFNLNTDIPSIS